jgi:hypothetical protein
MRPYIPMLDTNAVPWTAGAVPGIYRKELSFDPETKATTHISRIDPRNAPQLPSRPHYHHIDEELLVLKGGLSFADDQWLEPYSYCFHPPETVHGFKTGVRTEPRPDTWFLSRLGGPFVLNYPDPVEKWECYSVSGVAPERPPVYIPKATDSLTQDDGLTGGLEKRRVLSRHPRTGEGSMFLRLMPGWRNPKPAATATAYKEFYVLEGGLEMSTGHRLTADHYAFIPPGTEQTPVASADGALVYVNFGGALRDL